MEILPVINRIYELYKEIVVFNANLPKKWRYGLGLSMENTILDLVSNCVMAKNAPKSLKAAYLIKATSLQEVTVLKLRLYLDLEVVNETRIFQLQAKLSEIGRMLGGWLKSTTT
ncbi:MAG: four helix bundle protein [Patescibacteria group bacterium]